MNTQNEITRRRFMRMTGVAGALGFGSAGAVVSSSTPDAVSGTSGKSPREVRVLSVSRQGIDSDDPAGEMLERIHTAPCAVDIICLPEGFATSSAMAEDVPGRLTGMFAAVARELGSYLICPLHASKEGRVYNSAVLLDRRGDIAGQYDKIHPVSTECEAGITPGGSPPPVFRTDIGIIGIQICFDINWHAEWQSLKEQGAEIVFWPSAFIGGRMLSALAWINKYYVVGCCRRDPSQIFDITGDLIAESGFWEHWAYANLNLERVLIEIAYNSRKLSDMKRKYGSKVLIAYYHDEDWVTIESRAPDLRLDDLLVEYELLPHGEYIELEERLQAGYRK